MKIVENDKNSKEWFAVAFEQEFASQTHNVLYTGVGKINAAMATQKLIDTHQVSKIINIGTAGAKPGTAQPGTVYTIGAVIDRDSDIPGRRREIIKTHQATHHVCATGDSFITRWDNMHYEIVDMEAFAIAAVCQANNIQFECYKFISDNGSNNDWARALAACNKRFNEMFAKRLQKQKM